MYMHMEILPTVCHIFLIPLALRNLYEIRQCLFGDDWFDLICFSSACLVLVLYCFLSGEITWWSPLWVKELQADQFEVYNIPPSPPWPTLSSVVFSARGGFGKFEPFLGRVRSCNQNCKVFLADYTCFVFKFVVFKGKEFTFTELMALKKSSTRNSWSITLHFTKVLLSNLALGWGIRTQFWPEGVGGSRNLMFKWPGGLPKGDFEA